MPADLFHRYPPALGIVCPICGARPAQPCRNRNRHKSNPHRERTRLAEQGPRPTRTERDARKAAPR